MRRVLVVALGLLVTVGCPKKEEPTKKKADAPKRQLVLGTTTEPGTIDPAFVRASGGVEISRLSFMQLTEIDENWKVVPSLAAEVPKATTSTGGFAVPWKLKDGYKWSDGTPVTTSDVIFGYGVEANPNLKSISHQVAKNVAGIKPASDTEATVQWKSPYADFAAPRVHAVLPAHAYPAPKGTKFAGLGRAKIANGPFVVTEWIAGRHAYFDRNPGYGGPKPWFDRIVVRFFPSADALEAELITGGVDAVGEASGLPLDRAQAIEKKLPNHDIVYTDSGMLLLLVVRLDHPVLKDAEVRRAISEAIDRNVLVKLVYGGRGSPATGLFPPRHAGYDKSAAPFTFDVEAAKKRIGKAGANGKKIKIAFSGDSQPGTRAATYVQTAVKEIGVDVELAPAPFKVVYQNLRTKKHPALTLFAFRMRPDWNGRAALTPEGKLNFSGFSDEAVTSAIEKSETTMDPAAWGELMKSVDRRVRASLPLIPLVFRQAVSVRPKDLEGWKPTGTTTPVTWTADQWKRTGAGKGS